MKRLFILCIVIFYAIIFMAQTNDTVIIAWKSNELTKQQEVLFDTLQSQIFHLKDVKYFKKVSPSYANWNNYYHIRCAESTNIVIARLERSRLFDTIYLDKKVGVECANPVTTNDPLNNTYINDMLELPCAWSITTGNPAHTVGIIDSDFTNHEDLVGKTTHYNDFPAAGGFYKAPVDPLLPGFNDFHGLRMSGIIGAMYPPD